MDSLLETFYSSAFIVIFAVVEILKAWWWLLLFFILWPKFLELWLWWRQEVWSSKQKKPVILEIKVPYEVRRPIKTMENVFSSLWALYESANWKEKWIDGKYQLSYSLEIVSLDGEIKFLIRVPFYFKKMAEVAIYSQYPDAEITEFKDYTQEVPEDLPDNPDWDMWGSSWRTEKEDVFPIKTYRSFEAEGALPEEEERIDPLAQLLEGLSTLKKGEQMWIQLVAKPVRNEENNYTDRAKKIIEKLFGRETPEKKVKPIFREAAELLILGAKEEEEEKSQLQPFPSTLMKTPGELEVIKEIESKVSKKMYECHMRFIYLGKNKVFDKSKIRIPVGFTNQFSTENLNGLRPLTKTMTSVTHFFVKLRVQRRKRKIFRLYKKRLPPTWPKSPQKNGLDGVFVLNTEELASLYHFPSQIIAPTPSLPRVPSKRREAPREIPKEEQ